MNLAEQGRGQGHAYIHDAVQSARLDAAASSVKHKQLPNALRSGVGFHYAAMEQEDRAVVEQLFHDRMLPVSIFDASLRLYQDLSWSWSIHILRKIFMTCCDVYSIARYKVQNPNGLLLILVHAVLLLNQYNASCSILMDEDHSDSCLKVLCTTSTLAVGVNLPARLVVIKGTRRWSNEGGTKGYQEYDRSTCLQMMGRAGRPQFDTHGVAVIMTQAQVRPSHAETYSVA